MSKITINDYKQILEFYNKPIPKSKRLLRVEAEKIMATKLCRCIKKLDTRFEQKAIGICTKTIFNRKGYTRGKFSCKGKRTIKIKKIKKNITQKKKK